MKRRRYELEMAGRSKREVSGEEMGEKKGDLQEPCRELSSREEFGLGVGELLQQQGSSRGGDDPSGTRRTLE